MIRKTLLRFIVMFTLFQTITGLRQAICPNPTITAREGDDITLQCSLDPPINLVRDSVDVKTPDNEIVHAYRRGRDLPQMDQFRNRTTLNRDQLLRGRQEVQLSSVIESDSGFYRCSFPRWKTSCWINVTVVPKDQGNWTKRDHFNTTDSALDETEPGGETWKLVAAIASASVVGLVVLLFVALMKHGMIENCCKKQKAETMAKSSEIEKLRTRAHSAAENSLRYNQNIWDYEDNIFFNCS